MNKLVDTTSGAAATERKSATKEKLSEIPENRRMVFVASQIVDPLPSPRSKQTCKTKRHRAGTRSRTGAPSHAPPASSNVTSMFRDEYLTGQIYKNISVSDEVSTQNWSFADGTPPKKWVTTAQGSNNVRNKSRKPILGCRNRRVPVGYKKKPNRYHQAKIRTCRKRVDWRPVREVVVWVLP